MVLVNAIYFKGKWLNQFYLKKTYKADFYLANGSTQKVDMMRLNEELILKRDPAGLQALTCVSICWRISGYDYYFPT